MSTYDPITGYGAHNVNAPLVSATLGLGQRVRYVGEDPIVLLDNNGEGTVIKSTDKHGIVGVQMDNPNGIGTARVFAAAVEFEPI
ncbi:hypothetical protein [Sphingomonas sp.]|uniref:hypothetical protein n=1 Tax=Sphingomonas sp. TaxID=28214 RepID=UPI003F7E3992